MARLYRYTKGQRFGKHIDESSVEESSGRETQYTLLLYLNGGDRDELEGGETIFYEGRKDSEVCAKFPPKQGWGLFHMHGERCLTHEGAVVSQGTKYVLRTDILFE
jgi:hypothetical protein